ncbi:MFS transporter [Amycolatopsis nigrescens]|uniref:MFS transporter n=1 Tax=Amycolatopsis nigrescens TaxID=381445 RepID=UPI000375F94B|nr:MFS transporter [Amycolatopsis nigrescens]
MPAERSATRRAGLLRHGDFRRLWLADVLSQFGNRISVLAVPLLATTTLQASTFQVSLLRTLETAAYLALGLQVGAWCDRLRCRPVLIAADLGRAALLASVPVAWAFGALTIGQLLVVVLLTGVLTVFFDVAHQTYLPRLIDRERLLEGNAKLQTNLSVAAVTAPGLTGYLVQVFGGPIAIMGNALGFLWSAGWLGRIGADEPKPISTARPRLRREIGEGLRLVAGHPALRAICATGATASLFQSVQTSIVVVFLNREVGLSPGSIGLLSTTTLVGALAGALTARRLGERLGQARALLLAAVLFGCCYLLFPFTGPGWRLGFYAVAGFGASLTVIVLNVLSVSFQQTVTPERLRGRVNATSRVLMLGAIPVGSLLGGLLATAAGFHAALWVAAAGNFASAGWLLFSPVRRMRDLPEECEPAERGSPSS